MRAKTRRKLAIGPHAPDVTSIRASLRFLGTRDGTRRSAGVCVTLGTSAFANRGHEDDRHQYQCFHAAAQVEKLISTGAAASADADSLIGFVGANAGSLGGNLTI